MINVDAKIMSKVLALRIKHIIHTLIHHDQIAYVKNRFTGESIRLIDDILEYADDNDTSGIVFSADFGKAFDSIDHSFLFAVHEKFGFGPNFIHWIRTLWTNLTTQNTVYVADFKLLTSVIRKKIDWVWLKI